MLAIWLYLNLHPDGKYQQPQIPKLRLDFVCTLNSIEDDKIKKMDLSKIKDFIKKKILMPNSKQEHIVYTKAKIKIYTYQNRTRCVKFTPRLQNITGQFQSIKKKLGRSNLRVNSENLVIVKLPGWKKNNA